MIEIEEAKKLSQELMKTYWQKVIDRIYTNPVLMRHLGCRPEIYFREMKGDEGGRCHYAGWIEINMRYFPENDMRFIEEVVRHEISHAIAHRIYKSTGHDKPFYEVLTYLGGEHRRCLPGWVNDPVPRKDGVERKRYVCNKCGRIHYLSKRIINDVLEWGTPRMCVNCNNMLQNFISES